MPVRKIGDRWVVELCIKNERAFRRLPKGSTKAEAKALEAKLTIAIEKGRTVSIPNDPPLFDVMDLYMAHAENLRCPEGAKFSALRLADIIKGRTASEAYNVAQAYIRENTGKLKPASINKSIGTLKKALTIAYELEWTPENYGARIRRLPEHNERDEWISVEDAQTLCDAIQSEKVKATIWISLLTGARRGEILKMQPEDVEGDVLKIRAGNTKTLKTRYIPIVPALRPWLEHLPIGLAPTSINTTFQRAKRRTGLTHYHFHDLRHGCATMLVNMGVDLYTVQQILGHSTPRMTQRYAKVQTDAMRSALDKIGGLVRGAGVEPATSRV